MTNSRPILTRVNPKSASTKQKMPVVSTETEAIFINQSLTTLGRIFAILGNRKVKKSVPPYRESKLTRILQDSLTYDSKTVMIVNVCSEYKSIKQTKESLEFASRAMIAL